MKKKLLSELTMDDLSKNRVWEYLIEGNTEIVRPSNRTEIFDDNKNSWIVLTEFTLRNGQKHLGFCSPQDPSGLDYIQPVIITLSGHLAFYKETEWSVDDRLLALQFLGLSLKDVFPIEFKTKVKCDSNYYYGTIVTFNQGK